MRRRKEKVGKVRNDTSSWFSCYGNRIYSCDGVDLKICCWNFTGATLAPKTIEEFGGRFGTMASAFGNNIWQILALILCMCILIFGVGAGIEKANKILMPIFFALFVILGIYVVFQPGAAADINIFSESIRRPS